MTQRYDRYVPAIQAFGARSVLLHSAIARRLGLPATELNCFRLASRPGGVTATELARETGLTLPAMTAVVDRLEQVGYISRERDRNDRRRVIIRAEPAAMRRVDTQYARHSGRVAAMLDGFTDEQFEFLLRYLQEAEQLALDGTMSAPPSRGRAGVETSTVAAAPRRRKRAPL